MADNTKKMPRERKSNFTSIEANLISSRVVEKLDLLMGKHSNDVTNQLKNEMWKEITAEVNALGVCFRSEAEVRNKYRNMCRGAKEKFTLNRKETNKTGGGPPPLPLNTAEENIVNAMKDAASFIGIGGLESDIIPSESSSNAEATPTIQEQVWENALNRHHAMLERSCETRSSRTAAEGEDAEAVSVIPCTPLSASTCSTNHICSSTITQPPTKKMKKTAEDVYSLQCAVLERELVKTNLQIDLINKVLQRVDDEEASSMLALLS